MTPASHFQAGDRVRTLRPITMFDTNRYGTVLRVFFGAGLYDVLFDGQSEPRMVMAERLTKEAALLACELGTAA